jgi:hypothetical protein
MLSNGLIIIEGYYCLFLNFFEEFIIFISTLIFLCYNFRPQIQNSILSKYFVIHDIQTMYHTQVMGKLIIYRYRFIHKFGKEIILCSFSSNVHKSQQ